MMKQFRPWLLVSIAGALAGGTAAHAAAIDNTDKYAWSETSGWLNFAATGGNVNVYPDHLEGYVWADNTGWLHLGTHTSGGEHTYTNNSASSYGVNRNTSSGALSGYAWSETSGWINLGATEGNARVANDGSFSGYAWGDNIGWIKLAGSAANGMAYQVKSGALLTNAPTINPTNGVTLTGTGTAGDPLTVKDSTGNTVCTTTVGNDGHWQCTPDTPVAHGTQLTAQQGTATSTVVTVDNIPPSAPTLNPSSGESISGTGEPGAAITVSNGGTTVCTTTVANDGNWHCTPSTPVADSTTLNITQTDAAGNDSPVVTGQVDNTLSGLNLSSNNLAIAHNDNTPSGADNTDFGTLDVTTGQKTNDFVVTNHGKTAVTLNLRLEETGSARLGAPLERLLARLNPIGTAEAAGATDFTLNPATLTILAGGSANFSITFDPSVAGTRQAQVVLSSGSVSVFRFLVSGTGTGGPPPTNIPVFSPLGLLASLLGLLWLGRRRKR